MSTVPGPFYETDRERLEAAVEIAEEFGGIDGAHHKQWVIDGMLRALLDDRYDLWRQQYDAQVDENGDPCEPWDEGIDP